jgi:hypothetical protein
VKAGSFADQETRCKHKFTPHPDMPMILFCEKCADIKEINIKSSGGAASPPPLAVPSSRMPDMAALWKLPAEYMAAMQRPFDATKYAEVKREYLFPGSRV